MITDNGKFFQKHYITRTLFIIIQIIGHIINQLNITIMTKNEIIRELTKCNPQSIQRLSIIYHNDSANVRYIYEFTSRNASSSKQELAQVLFSLYKLRRYVVYLDVSYFSQDGISVRTFRSFRYVSSVSDFIKCVKSVKISNK